MIVDQLFTPKPLKEGNPYDLPGIDYDRPGDVPRRPLPRGEKFPRRHPDDPDFMDPDQRKLRADQERVAKAWADHLAKKAEQNKLDESVLLEDPVYRNFKRIGQYIAERKLTEPEILKIFADAEAGMTDKATGANRTFLGRGKDTAADFAGGVADALKGVWSDIQGNSLVGGVDVYYDKATDALADLTGGQKGQVMQAIKKYRMLAKQYPKTAGLAKGALMAIAGLATGGAGLPAAAAFIYGLDSAIKGEKLSDIALKAGGAAATAWAGQKIASAFGGDQAASGGLGDPSQLPPFDDAGNLAPGFHINPEDGIPYYNGELTPTPADIAAGYGPDGAATAAGGPMGGGTYTVVKGDQLGYIAQANGVSVEDIRGLNPQIDFSKPLQPGMEIQLPTAGTPGQGSVWQGYQGGMYGDKAAGAAGDTAQGLPDHPSAASDFGTGGNAPIDYTSPGPESIDSLGQKLEYGIPVNDKGSFVPPNPNLPPEELASQQAAYNAWKSDFMRRFPNATPGPDGSMLSFKPGLAPMYPSNAPTGALPLGLTPKVQESVKFKKLPFDKLVDEKSTVMHWALSESIGVKRKSVCLSEVGTYTVFENIRRVAKAVNVMELKGVPGSTRPAYYRPDMPGAPDPTKPPKNQSWFGKGLDYLDKGVKKVGGALSNFGHQFTTNVTKEKLKMNWHQAGKPSDSDQLAAWLVKQGVPINVVNGVYEKMGLPVSAQPTAPTTPDATTEPQAKTGTAQRLMPFNNINPKTGQRWTVDDLEARRAERNAQATAATNTAPAPAPTATKPTAGGPAGFNAGNVFNMPGMDKYAKPAATPPAKTPNFAGPGGYGKTTMSVKPMTGVPGMKTTPAPAPVGPKVTSGGPTPDEQAKLAQRIAQATAKPVAEMLQMVETKEDVQRIKQFVDETFVKYGAVNESAFALRNQILEHVTQVGAQRRREHSRKAAH